MLLKRDLWEQNTGKKRELGNLSVYILSPNEVQDQMKEIRSTSNLSNT
jgi:hypothetical protein